MKVQLAKTSGELGFKTLPGARSCGAWPSPGGSGTALRTPCSHLGAGGAWGALGAGSENQAPMGQMAWTAGSVNVQLRHRG